MRERHRRVKVRKMLGVAFMMGMVVWAAAIEVGLPSPGLMSGAPAAGGPASTLAEVDPG